MAKFVCTKCNYKFEAKSARMARSCPYCGEENVEQEKSASEIIDEISDMLGE